MGGVGPVSSAGSIPTPRTYRKEETGRIDGTGKIEEKRHGFSPGFRRMAKFSLNPAGAGHQGEFSGWVSDMMRSRRIISLFC